MYLKKHFFIEVYLIYNAVLITAIQKSDSVIHIYTLLFIFFSVNGLSLDIEYSLPCYTVKTCCLSILCIIICIC